MTGVIASVKQGFGFIDTPEGDVFFHRSELRGLVFGETLVRREVEFDIGDQLGRSCAVNVRPATMEVVIKT